ncbi:MAG: DUF3999 domain-containing protein [Pseudomonadota bacterium]|nr:DUF3999 domain-containing protein [Pseudomonadota bacterium]
MNVFMKQRLMLAVLALQCGAASALAPEDFASGMTIEGDTSRPVWQLELPDAVYGGVLRQGLGDLRVFNAEQIAVPHALCNHTEVEEVSPPQGREVELPVFPLQAIREAKSSTIGLNLTAPEGSDIHVDIESAEPSAESGEENASELSGYVIDATALDTAIVSLKLRWATSDGASEVPVRVETSDNLDQWRIVVPQTNLVRLTSSSATLERSRIALPAAHYRYLRLVRADDGPAPAVEAVIAETILPTKAKAVPLRWFDAQARSDSPEAMFDYDAARRAPVQAARIALPVRNQLVTLKLQSRATDQSAWVTRWQGEQSNFNQGEPQPTSADIHFPATSDPSWRVIIVEGREAFGDAAPALTLAYVPQVLRFVAQGQGPFTIAYGSANAESAPQRDCNWWQKITGGNANTMLAPAFASAEFSLSGVEAKTPKPAPTPFRRYLLWGVLGLAAALVVAMALSLLRRVRTNSEK